MNSFFLLMLVDAKKTYIYENVREWTKKFDVFACDKLFFPCNISNTHWTMVVIFMQQKRICYYDSLAGEGVQGLKYLEGLRQWLADEHVTKKGSLLDTSVFELVPGQQATTPQQTNGNDCGVFSAMFADFLSDDLDLMSFQQADIPMFRRKIAHYILKGELDY